MSQTKLLELAKPQPNILLDNELVPGSGAKIDLVNPKDSKQIQADLNAASEEQVDQAVRNARRAFETGPWSTYSGEQRAQCLHRLADLIESHGEQLAYLESICSGRPIGMLAGFEIPKVAGYFRYYAGWADKIKGSSFPADDGFYKIVRKEPLGVCAGIAAWNASLLFLSWKTAPALAAGNTVIMKPSEKSPLGMLGVAALIKAAGFPPGVFQILSGTGEVGAILASHMDIDKISFTGSTLTGRKIQNAATNSNLKRVTLELGGKSPGIIFEDANMEQAIFWSTVGITVNTGQVCAATSRLLVEESVLDTVLNALKQGFEGIEKGLGADPQDPTCQYGPIVDKIQYDKVWQYIEEGRKTNNIVAGGTQHTKGGYYIAPVLFVNPGDDTPVWREEIFGPVLCVKTFKTEEEAIKLANDTSYGLAGAVFTRDIAKALRVSAKVKSGTVYINNNLSIGTHAPMGGKGSSGIGRELGEEGLDEYTETKTIWINSQ